MDGLHKIATLAFEAAETVAIASGVLTIAQTYISIDAESGSTDTLDTITLTSAPANYGVWLLLKAASGDTITISHNSGNIKTANGSNISLTGDKHLYAFHNGTNVFVADAGGSGAPTDATYIVQTASGSLSNEQAMGALATGIVKNTTTTGVQSIAAAGTDYTSPTGTENLSNKTITDSSIIATALSLILGGFRAIFTHAFSADRTVTIPGDADVTLVGLATTQTLTNKTLTTPTIASFTNATHDHSNAAGGGQITDAALSSAVGISKGGTGQTTATAAFDALAPTTTAGDLIYSNGTDNVRLPIGTAGQVLKVNSGATAPEWDDESGGGVPLFYRAGLGVVARTAALLEVGVGEITVESTIVSKTATTLLNMATAGDWIGGSTAEAASTYVNIFANAAGDVKLYNKMPNYPRANTASRITTMRVNQSGWNGTGGSGLNATSIVYDADSGGEGSVTAGMLLGVYNDSTFETGRGRGSGAAASVNNASFALITAINTGTDTLTVAAGHNIAINDDDYLIVIEYGALEYINVSGTWWRLIDRVYNNSSSDLDNNQIGHTSITSVTGGDINSGSTSFVAASASLIGSILSHGVSTSMKMQANMTISASQRADLTFFVDGLNIGGTDGLGTIYNSIIVSPSWQWHTRLLPGTHTLQPYWKVTGGTGTIYTLTTSVPAMFSIEDKIA